MEQKERERERKGRGGGREEVLTHQAFFNQNNKLIKRNIKDLKLVVN